MKDPGISITDIRLLKANFGVVNLDAEPKYRLQLTGLDRTEHKEGNVLAIMAAFDLMFEIEKPMLDFSCLYIAHYQRQDENSMAWKDFSTPVALAHIIPYLREFISSTTLRLPITPLYVSPVNTHLMVAQYEKLQKESGEPEEVPSKASPP